MTDTDTLAELLLQHEAQGVLHTYTRLVDNKDLDGLAAIAHPDVVLERADGRREGRAHFVDLYRQFAASDVLDSQHMVTNVTARRLDSGTVRVDAAFLAITTHPDGARLTWGRYEDDLALLEGRLVLAAKRIRVVRTALMDEAMLAPVNRDSFGPMPSDS